VNPLEVIVIITARDRRIEEGSIIVKFTILDIPNENNKVSSVVGLE
jgi:hypothetical protein